MSRKSGSRFAATPPRIFSAISSDVDQPFPGQMTATFRKFLVFEVTTGQTRRVPTRRSSAPTFSAPPKPVSASTIAGILTACAIKPASSATSVRVSKPTSGRPAVAVRQTRAADINRIKARAFHLPRHRSIRHARHRHAAFCDQIPQLSCLRHVRWASSPTASIRRDFVASSNFQPAATIFCAPSSPKRGHDQSVKFPFELLSLTGFRALPKRIIDALGQGPAVVQGHMNNVGHRFRDKAN